VKRIEGPGSFRLRARFGGARSDLTSDEFTFTLLEAPRVRDIRVTYSYPGYAARPPRTQEGGAVDALLGTNVLVEMTPDSPLASARLSPPGGKAVEMSRRPSTDSGRRPESAEGRRGKGRGERWVGGFTVRRSGSYEIALTGEGGPPGARSYPVVARPDSAPRANAVYDQRPAREVLSRGATFNVRASDDLGLEELVLVVKREKTRREKTRREKARREKAAGATPRRARPGGGPSPEGVFYIPAPGFERGRREVDLGFTIPPQVMELEPGVTYRYYVRAADGRRPEPHLVTSSPRTFKIDPPETDALLARSGSRKKKRPPLLEPKARGPKRDRPRGEGPSPGGGARPPPSSRRLAGLEDPPGSPGSVPPRRPSRKPDRPPKLSRYASAPGLAADEAGGADKPDQKERDRDGQGPGGRDRKDPGKGGGKRASSRGGGTGSDGPGDRSKGGRGGKPDLPGQGEYGGGGRKTAGGRPTSSGGPGTSGPGGGRTASSSGRGGTGGRSSGTPEGTPGSNRPGGAGGRNTGLPNRTPAGGGRPSGGETGGGDTPRPETIDKKAVAGLDVRPEEVASVRVPGSPRASRGGQGEGMIDKVSDLGRGSSRSRVGRLTGRDRLTIPKQDVPPLEILHSRPVSRAYRPLVGEYFRRLRELAERE
jgi:hypothetical protein